MIHDLSFWQDKLYKKAALSASQIYGNIYDSNINRGGQKMPIKSGQGNRNMEQITFDTVLIAAKQRLNTFKKTSYCVTYYIYNAEGTAFYAFVDPKLGSCISVVSISEMDKNQKSYYDELVSTYNIVRVSATSKELLEFFNGNVEQPFLYKLPYVLQAELIEIFSGKPRSMTEIVDDLRAELILNYNGTRAFTLMQELDILLEKKQKEKSEYKNVLY